MGDDGARVLYDGDGRFFTTPARYSIRDKGEQMTERMTAEEIRNRRSSIGGTTKEINVQKEIAWALHEIAAQFADFNEMLRAEISRSSAFPVRRGSNR